MFDALLENEFFWVVILALYAFGVILFTRHIYDYLVRKRIKRSVAVYYNRKIIHIFAGGVVVLAVPFAFDSPWYPILAGIILAILMYLLHLSGRILYWFQTKEDFNDVSFCFMWAIAIFILWTIFNDPWIAVIPPAFIAFGDGITGIVRNLAFKERKKHPIGNIYMMGVCIPIGYYFAYAGVPSIPIWGIIAAIIASLFERYEFGIIDDNILVAGSATIVLYLGGILGPI